MKDFNELVEEKKKSDKRQRRKSAAILLLSLSVLAIVYILITRTTKENVQLVSSTRDTIDSIRRELRDTIQYFKNDIIECTGVPSGKRTSKGIPLYNLTMRISDTSIVSSLKKVEYFFNDDSYKPKLKISDDSSNCFSIQITNSWGCLPIVPVYLYYKNNSVDTIIFPMCDKTMLQLSFIK